MVFLFPCSCRGEKTGDIDAGTGVSLSLVERGSG